MNTKKFPVAEIFGPTIQGEGPAAGRPTYFIRFGGCDYRCVWCDSMHAVEPEKVALLPKLTTAEIIDQLRALPKGAFDVVLSGGNPVIWDLTQLVMELNDLGYWIHVETQGSAIRDWLRWVDEIIVSPKPPSSKMTTEAEITQNFLKQLRQLAATQRMGSMNVSLKYVAFDETDLNYIRHHSEMLGLEELYISVGTKAEDATEDILMRYRMIIQQVLEHPMPISTVKILPQMHVLLWGHKLGV